MLHGGSSLQGLFTVRIRHCTGNVKTEIGSTEDLIADAAGGRARPARKAI